MGLSRYQALRIIDSGQDYFDSVKIHHPQLAQAMQKARQYYRFSDQTKRREEIIGRYYQVASELCEKNVEEHADKLAKDRKIDDIITSRRWGLPLMLLLLLGIFYVTIRLANYPSELLFKGLFYLESKFYALFTFLKIPGGIRNFLILGVYRTAAWVVAVMLPPMAIFFPLFTLLEDLGYLPRVAFNLDHHFKKACAHGKQCLTMCMGFGCNAAGVTGARIIDSPRERLVAILTNTFVPCNGRFPTIITIAGAFFAITSSGFLNSVIPVFVLMSLILLGIAISLLVSFLLSKTLLKGEASTFTLELPPYRRPKILKTLYTSLVDRTIFLLGRALKIAAPFGGVIWLLSNIYFRDHSLLRHLTLFCQPFGALLGMDGIILLAFILALPANEILLPLIVMGYLATNHLIEINSLAEIRSLFLQNGWTTLCAVNVLLFSLLHWPCSTTLLTIKKETGSWKWTAVAFIIPTGLAVGVCLLTTALARLFV